MGNGGQGIQRLLTGAAALVLMAGAAMGACREDKVDLRGGPGVLLLTGRNVGAATFDAVISGG